MSCLNFSLSLVQRLLNEQQWTTTQTERLHVIRAKRGHLRASDSVHNGFTSSLSNSWPHNLMDIVYISVSIAVVPFIRSTADQFSSGSGRRACIAFDICHSCKIRTSRFYLGSLLISTSNVYMYIWWVADVCIHSCKRGLRIFAFYGNFHLPFCCSFCFYLHRNDVWK